MSGMDPNDPMAQFKATFFEECAELTADLEQRLTDIEDGDTDPESINAVFRAVHSIKAGGGAFQFNDLVNFTQKFEAVLDDLRSDRLELAPDIIELLFKATDIQSDLIAAAQEGESVAEDFGADVLARFDELLEGAPASSASSKPQGGSAGAPAAAEKTDGAPDLDEAAASASAVEAEAGDAGAETGLKNYRIRFQPKQELFRHANEPLLLLRELAGLGEMVTEVSHDRLPDVREMEPEDSYFYWEILLKTDAGKEDIVEVFEFVEDDCDLLVIDEDGKGVFAEEGVDYGIFVDLSAAPDEIYAGTAPSSSKVDEEQVVQQQAAQQ